MRTHSIEINTDKFGFLIVEFTYEYNQYDNCFEHNAIEKVMFWECEEETNYDKLPKDVQADIDQSISEWLIFDANTGDYFESHEEEMR